MMDLQSGRDYTLKDSAWGAVFLTLPLEPVGFFSSFQLFDSLFMDFISQHINSWWFRRLQLARAVPGMDSNYSLSSLYCSVIE